MSEKKWYKPLYYEGHQAFIAGTLDCPFSQDTQKYKEWMRGFNDAYFENLGVRRRA